MSDNPKAAVLAAFAADSLALGAHWIYEPEKIRTDFGRIESPAAPGPDSFHKTKGRGDFTHYGDQMMVLLRSIAGQKGFDPADFSKQWRALFDSYDGYIDNATRKTLANYEKGATPENAGSSSNDLAGAARIAPLVALYSNDPEKLAAAARAQTAMTHNNEAVIDAAAFFARVVHAVLQGSAPVAAMESLAEDDEFAMSPISMYIGPGLKSADEQSADAIARFGPACEIDQALPGTIHLIARYEDNLKEALVQSVMAGGDSAARASIAGMILGAHLGMEAVSGDWIESVSRINEIRTLLDQITGL
ncbi:MAG: ADP-ribosylglycohydrolase family protein [Desulfosalsimonas sp.]